MQRSIVAALVALSLGACSSDNDSTSNIDGSVANTPNTADLPILSADPTAVVDVADIAVESESAGDAVAEPVSNETPVNGSTGNGGVVAVENSSTNSIPTNTDSSGQSGNSSNTANDPAGDNANTDTDSQNQDSVSVITENVSPTDSDDDADSATSNSGETAAQIPAVENNQNDTAGQNTDSAISNDAGSAPSNTGETAPQTPDTQTSQGTTAGQNTDSAISDDAASATSDGGETPAQNPDTENNQNDAAGQNTGAIRDDAVSATSDGGETASQASDTENNQNDAAEQNAGGVISDDAASATSDGGETPAQNPDTDNSQNDAAGQNTDGAISDDAASATSDGGETASQSPDTENNQNDAADEGTNGLISDDAASATSDGGQINADDASGGTIEPDNSGNNSEASNGGNAPQAGPADFESNNTGGTVLRRSALSAGDQVNICSTASDPQNFSDTRIGDFILHNNVWRPQRAAPGYEWTQCIQTNTNGALAGWNYDWGPGISGIGGNPNPSGDYYVRSYPELIYGVKDEFRTSAPKAVTGLPVELSELPNITISYSYDGPQFGDARTVTGSNNPRFPNGSTISGERNVAVESFLYNPDANGECSENIVTRNGGSNHVYEVMVWLDAGAERLPAGPDDFVTDVNIRGEAFKVYTKGSDNRYVAFVAQNPQTSGTLVWNDFTDWAKTYAHQVSDVFGAKSNSVQIQDSWCVANIIVGTEIFWGAGNLDIYDWTITQSR